MEYNFWNGNSLNEINLKFLNLDLELLNIHQWMVLDI